MAKSKSSQPSKIRPAGSMNVTVEDGQVVLRLVLTPDFLFNFMGPIAKALIEAKREVRAGKAKKK